MEKRRYGVEFQKFPQHLYKKDSPTLHRIYYIKVPDLDDLTCDNPAKQGLHQLTTLTSYDFVCRYWTECSDWTCECCLVHTPCYCRALCYKSCACFHASHHGVNFVNCTSRNMTNLPVESPYYAKKIALDDNNLTQVSSSNLNFPFLKELMLNKSHISMIDANAFENLKSIKVIYLQDNDIEVLRPTFANISVLSDLYLHNNRIHLIENGSFDHLFFLKTLWLHKNHLSHVDLTLFDKLVSLTELTLHDNPWQCDCEFGPVFKVWLLRHHDVIKNVRNVHCKVNQVNADPNMTHTFSNRTFVHIPMIDIDFYYCRNASFIQIIASNKFAVVAGVLSTAIAFIVLGMIIVAIHKNRLLLRVWAYNHYGIRFRSQPEDFDNGDKPFDVGVGNVIDDEEFILDELLPQLEDGELSYRMCLPCRDWPAGKVHTDIIIAAVHQSKRTILVVSESSIEANWWRYYFHMAHYQVLDDRQIRLILVLTDRSLLSQIEGDLKYYIRSGTYLVVGEKGFWDKLRYYLADNPRGAVDVDAPDYRELNVNWNRVQGIPVNIPPEEDIAEL